MKTLKEFAKDKVEDYMASVYYRMRDVDFERVVEVVLEAEEEWWIIKQEADICMGKPF